MLVGKNKMWFQSYEHVANKYGGFESVYPIIKRGIFLDTAPLFILICGHYDRINGTKIIENFCSNIGEDSHYKLYDYDYLFAFLNSISKSVPLYLTPHIFTEFIKHLTKYVKDPKQFNDILHTSFKSKGHIKDMFHEEFCDRFFCEDDFLSKTLEVGDISIVICAKKEMKKKGAMTVLTDDKTFAMISANKHKLITIYYSEIRGASQQLGKKNIPLEYLKE